MRKFLLGTIIYLLVGCLVTADFIDRQRGGRADAVTIADTRILGPFVWPVLLAQSIKDVADKARQDKIREDALAMRVRSCPPGFERQCRTYYKSAMPGGGSAADSSRDYRELLALLQAGKLPQSEPHRSVVLEMAAWYASRQEAGMEQIIEDLAPLLEAGAGAQQNLAGAGILATILRSNCGNAFYKRPYAVAPSIRPLLLETLPKLITLYEALFGLEGPQEAGRLREAPCLPLGLGTLYECYAAVLPEGEGRRYWLDKAAGYYAAVALRHYGNADGVNAMYNFCVLPVKDEERLELIQKLYALYFEGSPRPDVAVLCPPVQALARYHFSTAAPPLGGDGDKRELLDSMWGLFADQGALISATRYLIPMFSNKSDRSYSFKWRKFFYTRYHKTGDARWLEIILPVLQYNAEYDEERLFFEAERAWIGGDKEQGARLLEEFVRNGDGWPGPLSMPFEDMDTGAEFLDVGNEIQSRIDNE